MKTSTKLFILSVVLLFFNISFFLYHQTHRVIKFNTDNTDNTKTQDNKYLNLILDIYKNDVVHVKQAKILYNLQETHIFNNPDNTYMIVILDSNNNVLKTITFDVNFWEYQNSNIIKEKEYQSDINIIIKLPENYHKVRIIKKNAELILKEFGLPSVTNKFVPILSIPFINNKQAMDGIKIIKWDVENIDISKVVFNIYYLNDKYSNEWIKIKENVSGVQTDIDFNVLKGCEQCKIKIKMINKEDLHDILETESNYFKILNKSPDINILSPINGKKYYYDSYILLFVQYNDIEDGNDEKRFKIKWYDANTNKVIMTGNNKKIKLPMGHHKIRVEVTDMDNNTSKQEVVFTVGFVKS